MGVADKWWFDRREELETLADEKSPVRIYVDEILNEILFDFLYIDAVEKVFYKTAINPHPRILEKVHRLGAGFRCVSRQEIERLSKIFPDIRPDQFMFTPGLTRPDDYEYAFERDIAVVLNDVYPIKAWPNVFEKKKVFLQVLRPEEDPVKPGFQPSEIENAAELLKELEVEVKGLRVESGGNNFFESGRLGETVSFLEGLASLFSGLSCFSLENEIGLSGKPGTGDLGLQGIKQELEAVREAYPGHILWIELGSIVFSDAGVMLTTVIQSRERKGQRYVRTDMGMEMLLRQEICGRHPEILNLSRPNENATMLAHIIGKEGTIDDNIGFVTRLAAVEEGDILLITNTGISSFPLAEKIKEHYLNARKMCPVNIA